MSSDIILVSEDGRISIRLAQELVEKMRDICLQSYPYETGGILVGFYTHDHKCAMITDMSDAPPDSKRGRTWFHRGTQGLQEWLNDLWARDGRYYLGEWHFHPKMRTVPSGDDIRTMKRIAQSASYNCPKPILVIIETAFESGYALQAHVFAREARPIELRRLGQAAEAIEAQISRIID